MSFETMVGKTISAVSQLHKPGYSDTGWLQITFTDGTTGTIVSSFGSYYEEPGAIDEYPTRISYAEGTPQGLVPIKV